MEVDRSTLTDAIDMIWHMFKFLALGSRGAVFCVTTYDMDHIP